MFRGHGVQSGVLIAMFKTALRGQLLRGGCPAQLFEEVHRTLFPLKLSNMFVTAGILQSKKDGEVAFALAGHPSILHCHENSGEVREYAAMDPPLGIMERQEFSESANQCGTGDVLLILTDGLTEVFDARGNEMGVEPLKESLRRNAGLPLAELFEKLRAVSTQFGRQIDDQTLLLPRYRS